MCLKVKTLLPEQRLAVNVIAKVGMSSDVQGFLNPLRFMGADLTGTDQVRKISIFKDPATRRADKGPVTDPCAGMGR
jgi:hypothetical protein